MASTFGDQKLREFLLAQSPVWLTEQLLSAAADNSALLAALQVAAGSNGAQVVRRELDRAIWVADFIEWEDVATYVHDVERALGLLADCKPAWRAIPIRRRWRSGCSPARPPSTAGGSSMTS